MSDRWLTSAQAIDVIRAHVGGSVGRCQAVLKAARASGEVRADPGPMLLMADDGVVGMSLRLGSRSRTFHGIDSEGKPVTHTVTNAGGSTFSEDDLLDWLKRSEHAKQDLKPAARRTPPEQARALKAMMAVYGKIPPQNEVSNPVLEQAVNKYLKQEGLEAVKKDAIQRAGGRRK